MTKFDQQPLCQKYFFGMIRLHAHAQHIYIGCTKYQKASVKALVRVDFTVYALSKHKQNPYIKANRKKMAKFIKLSFCHKNIFWHQTSACKCSMCLYYIGKISNRFSNICGTS